jgi:hypothetical protein
MTREAIVALLADREDAFRQRDAARLGGAYAADAVLVSPIFGNLTGRAAIEASHVKLFTVFTDMQIDTDPPIVDGDRAIQPFAGRASHSSELFGMPPSGRTFDLRGVFGFTFRDGLIVHERRLYDFTGLLLQLGVLKTRTMP